MTTTEKFRAKLDTLTTAEIIDAIEHTWDAPEGLAFREWGFDIIADRDGEDESDRIYSEMWHKHAA